MELLIPGFGRSVLSCRGSCLGPSDGCIDARWIWNISPTKIWECLLRNGGFVVRHRTSMCLLCAATMTQMTAFMNVHQHHRMEAIQADGDPQPCLWLMWMAVIRFLVLQRDIDKVEKIQRRSTMWFLKSETTATTSESRTLISSALYNLKETAWTTNWSVSIPEWIYDCQCKRALQLWP